MTTHTDDSGRRFEDLYDACMKLPADEREDFIARSTERDPELGRQLRIMIQLDHSGSASPFETGGRSRRFRADDLTSGAEFGKCRIINLIDTGAMGAVYFALDLQNHERPVALKVMQPTLLAEKDRERFMRESAALSRLVHPNIARLYFRDVETWNGTERPFLVMEFVAGATLDKFLAQGRLSQKRILELLCKIARAVHHGHRNGVFHRDLKPSNILVSPDGEPKIIDYGVSFTVSSESTDGSDSVSNENAGTVPYMAPEVASGAAYIPDARTDVYSLGIIAFEAFAQRRPGVVLASGEVELLDSPTSSRKMRNKIAGCERERLRSAHRGAAGDLDCVIAKALRLNLENRYADAGEFSQDLRRLIESEPIAELRRSRLYSARLFVRRNQLAVIAAALIFAIVLGSAVNYRSGVVREKILREAAELDRDQIRRDDATAHFKAAQLFEQRGLWASAADEYRQAEEGGLPDRLGLAVGRLRALDRMGKAADANALIDRIDKNSPDIGDDPEFLLVKGFFLWTADPARSVEFIRKGLATPKRLQPADLAFAQALISDDLLDVSAKLRKSLDADPFNHDALALISLCDLALGQTVQCEQDAGALQRLFPADGTGSVMMALAAAFQGDRAQAISLIEARADITADLKGTLKQCVDLISSLRSVDQASSISLPTLIPAMAGLADAASALGESGNLRQPMLFSKFMTGEMSQSNLLRLILNHDGFLKIVSTWPNGNGKYCAGWQELKQGHYTEAASDFQAAIESPSLIDCRRSAAALLTLVHFKDNADQHLPVQQSTAILNTDLNRLISLGGIRPDIFDVERQVEDCATARGRYSQLKALTLAWLAHAPKDPLAMYYLATADYHLGHPELALGEYQTSITMHVTGLALNDAKAKVADLLPLVTTRPATMP